MQVRTVGDGAPEIAVVACQHGDERCGAVAIERVLASLDPENVQRPVAFVIANERARAAGVRSIDADLNRVFPGDPDGAAHEERLAADLASVLADVELVLDLHSTESDSDPFVIVHSPTHRTVEVASSLGLSLGVDMTSQGGALLAHVPGVAVECGRRGSDDAADVATAVTRRFLVATGAVSGAPTEATVAWYRVEGTVPKDDRQWTLLARNFERVEAGTAFARAGEEEKVASEPFYPVLLSPEGYDDILGFRATAVSPAALVGEETT